MADVTVVRSGIDLSELFFLGRAMEEPVVEGLEALLDSSFTYSSYPADLWSQLAIVGV